VLLTRCSFEVLGGDRRPLTSSRRAEILQVNEALAGEALRTLGVAALWLPADVLAEYAARPDKRVEQDLVFAGLIGRSTLSATRRRTPWRGPKAPVSAR
jgi:P-type Ca2+ transporter type 2C